MIEEMNNFSDWEDRYKFMINLGKELTPMPEEYRIDDNKVKGCQSQVWLFPEFNEGKVLFYADSDASIVKGIVAILLSIYNHSTPDEILNFGVGFIDELGLKQHLSMSRSNGLAAMLKQIQMYAIGLKAKAAMGI
jgi:cysteine desulfuration protein SufE